MTNPTFQDFSSQGEEIQKLQTQIRNHRMSHALLITGENGTGKRTLSRLIAAGLLCTEEGNQPCGRCSGCTRVYDNEHPDLICIEKGIPLAADAKKSKAAIPIDDIREMIRLSSSYSFEGGNRVVLISNAEDMTVQAQNCLLKILEEPPENTYFILTSGHPEQLLVTIRSRCRFLKMKPWDEDQIIQILTKNGISKDKACLAASSCNGSIGYAKQLTDDEDYWKTRDEIVRAFFGSGERSRIISVSSQWKEKKTEAEQLFDILEEYIRIMLQHRITKRGDDRLQHISKEWKDFAATADIERFVFLLDRISDSRKQYGSNVNIQAIVDQLLLSFIGEIQS
jgi:DNA polymerase-3 subunit delta'